ncbi:MAG: glycosyltransferase family 4 protein, partial [Gemmatimonadales bacterium]
MAVLFDSAGFLQTLPLTGAAARTLHLNAALHARGWATQLLLCDLNPDSHPSTAWPLPVSYLDYAEVYGRPDRLITRLCALEPELLVMSNTELTVRYGRAVADAAGAGLVYEMHDDEAGLLASIGSRPADCRAAALLQGAAAVTADGVIAFSARDAARAVELGARQIHLVPCGATVHPRPRAEPPIVTGPPRVGFVGNLHYEPNLRALCYLAHRLSPHLRERAVIDVFGRYPPLARGLAAHAIAAGTLALHGPVGDLPGALAQMTIAVAPLDSGGGMKIKTLDYLAAGLATAGTEEAFVGLDRPDEVALISHDPRMTDLPQLVDVLLDAPTLRAELGARARERVACHHGWATVAGIAQHAYQVIAAAARASRSPQCLTHHRPVPGEIIKLARRTPYWLAEWRSRAARSEDNAPMTEQGCAQAADSPEARPGRLAVDIDCARLAATAALGISFDAEAAVGYAGRSMVLFAPSAVLKVYTHRPGERAHREVAGIELAATHACGVRIAEILGHDDVPGGLSWIATTRLPGAHPSHEKLATPA